MEELPQRKWLYHTPPSGVTSGTYFITLCCQKRGPNQLCKPEVAAKLFEAVSQFYQKQRWFVWLWLLMPDHLHGIVACPRTESLKQVMAAWKRYTAKAAGIKWQKGFFDHRLRNNESFEEKAAYIRKNPVRAGLVAKEEEWPYVWRPEG